jgi:DNA-binding NarL/FixJ family response regulator
MGSDCGAILVVDRDEAFRDKISSTLERAGFRTQQAASGGDALDAVRDDPPALVLLEVELPDVSGFEVCRQLRDAYGEELAIVFVSGERTESIDRVAGLLIGADDYFAKPLDCGEVIARVRRLLVRAGLGVPADNGGASTTLTARELEILRLLASGQAQDAIARSLVISPKTVSTHIQRILTKLGVHSRAEAIAAAYRMRLTNEEQLAGV